ncbi:hypothetical protein LINPERPRIM_LOCUS37687, partial [Linum perenne]
RSLSGSLNSKLSAPELGRILKLIGIMWYCVCVPPG